jgi:spore photoproduct lyase
VNPRRVWIEANCEEEPLAHRIRQALRGVPLETIPPGERPPAPEGSWTLRRQRGRFLKPCPGTRNYLCCGYHVLNPVLGCPFGCAYCILEEYLGQEEITIFVNLRDALGEVRELASRKGTVVRIGTGELGDSLALDPWLGTSETLVPFFATLPNAILELKTKSDRVEALLDLPHGGHTVVSWSINPPRVIEMAEAATASLHQRLDAARRCQERGYPLGLHLDPMVCIDGWEEEYRQTLETVFGLLDPGGIIWVSIGGLRYPPHLQGRLLESGLGLGELLPGLDGKLRYLRPIRARMFRHAVEWIRELAGDVFVYLCMEGRDVWEASLGWAPRGMAHLDRLFQERISSFRRRRGPSSFGG